MCRKEDNKEWRLFTAYVALRSTAACNNKEIQIPHDDFRLVDHNEKLHNPTAENLELSFPNYSLSVSCS